MIIRPPKLLGFGGSSAPVAGPPTFVVAGTRTTTGTTGTVTCTGLSDVQVGDVILLVARCFMQQTVNYSPTAPSGWTLLHTVGGAGGHLHVWWRRAATTSIPNATFSSTTYYDETSETDIYGPYITFMAAYRNIIATGNPHEAVTSYAGAFGTAASFATVTSLTAGSLIVGVGGSNLTTSTFSGYSNANLTGLVERVDQLGVVAIDGTKATAGATGAIAVTKAGSNSYFQSVSIALKKAA